MLAANRYAEALSDIRGKVVAIIYIFEGEDAPGFKHYDIWRGDLIGEWVQAIHELNCLPLLFDTRTFIQKAMDNTLPKIDYVVNLNNGTVDVSALGLIPSVCSFLSIPCIPCNTVSSIVGEHKLFSNLIAYAKKINVPENLCRAEGNGILRPLTCGSSVGVMKGPVANSKTKNDDCLYQKFICGFDMTTPIMYNPLTSQLDILPPIMYYPLNNNIEWFLGEDEKRQHEGYEKRIVKISNDAKERYISLARVFSINTFCRIDARVQCETSDELCELSVGEIALEQIYFLEINPMPTIKKGINFHTSIQGMTQDDSMYASYEIYRQEIDNPSTTGFILSSSMISIFRAMYEK
jgi:D-alanine-D-alanine ligase-like ATP-grasp enzyme